ncbi:SIS domain-containing protein [Endozoicomonas lisbonensis]|uniref:Tagatose-6-phosphate ketose/aldose isomerase n=1 Tax=Endozoicomonas lisbonensis TaxID=3120522 RepID=A0ABV2SAR4_9GAMM
MINLHDKDTSSTPAGGYWTEKEIHQQPALWEKSVQNVRNQQSALNEFLQPLLQRPNLRILFSGAGTSAFAGEVLAPHLAGCTGRRFDAVSTTDIVASPDLYLAEKVPTLLVSFARSGCSPESVATVQLVDQLLPESWHLVLTCNPEGTLFRNFQQRQDSYCLLMPEGSNDKGFAMTSSFTCMMLSALCIFTPDSQFAEQAGKLQAHSESLLRNNADAPMDIPDRLIFLGSGPLNGIAREAALKCLELTAGAINCSYDSPLGFRHGPKSAINEKTTIIVFLNNRRHTRQYDLDLLSEIRRENQAMNIVALDFSDTLDESIDGAWLAFPCILYAQQLAFNFSWRLGITPDNPCPSGEVNRVVQGVTIYPYEQADF